MRPRCFNSKELYYCITLLLLLNCLFMERTHVNSVMDTLIYVEEGGNP